MVPAAESVSSDVLFCTAAADVQNGPPVVRIDLAALRAELAFERGQLTGMTLRFYPITVTTDQTYNNYSPDFLTGKAAERVLNKMKKSTGYDLGGFDEKDGAVISFPVHEK